MIKQQYMYGNDSSRIQLANFFVLVLGGFKVEIFYAIIQSINCKGYYFLNSIQSWTSELF